MKRIGCILLVAILVCLCLPAPVQAAQIPRTKLIALTFDDGPELTYTPQVLDVLASRRVKATFFLVGKWLPGKRALVERIAAEGHQVANHTFDHESLADKTPAEIRQEVERTEAALREILPQEEFMVRPPFGLRSEASIAAVPAPVIFWSVDPAKGKQVSGERMARMVISSAKDGDIVLLHDTTRQNLDAVLPIIDALHAKGFEFVTVEELFRLRGIHPQAGEAYKRGLPTEDADGGDKNLGDHWAYASITTMQAKGLMNGDGQGWYPDRPLTRGSAVTVLWRLCGQPTVTGGMGFSDVGRGSTYAAAARWAGALGLAGEKGRRFGAAEPVTREQLYVMVARLVRLQPTTQTLAADYPHYGDDARISPDARDSVAYLRRLGFDSANDVELFRPKDAVTRAEAAELFQWYLAQS